MYLNFQILLFGCGARFRSAQNPNQSLRKLKHWIGVNVDLLRQQKLVRLCGPQQYLMNIKNKKMYMEYIKHINIWKLKSQNVKIITLKSLWKKKNCWDFKNCLKSDNMFLLFLIQVKGWHVVYRIEETKLVCAISRKLIWVEKHIFFA